MPGRQGPIVAGRHGLEHVERLTRAALADDDPVGAHVHRVAEQVADRDLPFAFEVGRARLEGDHVVLAKLELGRVLDRDDPLVPGDERRQDVQRRRLARAGATGDEDIEFRLDARLEEREHVGRGGSESDQVVDRKRRGRELSDRDDRPHQGQRLDDRVHPRPVGETRVDARAGLVDPPAKRGDDPVDDPQDVLVVEEGRIDPLDLSVALDVDVGRAVDHDLGDSRVGEERLQRPETGDVVDHLADEAKPLLARQGVPVLTDHAVHEGLDLGTDLGVLGLEQVMEGADALGLQSEPDLAQQILSHRGLRLHQAMRAG